MAAKSTSGNTQASVERSPGADNSARTGNVGSRPESSDVDAVWGDNARNADEHVGPIQGVTQGASNVFGDIMDLADLQIRLFQKDAVECGSRARFGILGLLISLAVLLASLPVLALGISELIRWTSEWPLWVCHLIVGVGFSLMGVGIGFWCLTNLRSSLNSFSTSHREASENIRWLRQTLSKTFS